MAEGYRSRHTGPEIDESIGRVQSVPAGVKDGFLHINEETGQPEWSAVRVDDAMSSSSENPVQNKAVKAYIDGLMSGALRRKIVSSLPTQDIESNVVYMILKQEGDDGDYYTEYLYIEDKWEIIGSTQMKVDAALSSDSTNPVQNKVIKVALDEKLSKGEFEEYADNVEIKTEETEGAPEVRSIIIGGDAYNVPKTVVDDGLSGESTNSVQNKVVKQALDAKQGKLTPGNGITIDDNNVISGSSQITVDEQLSDTSDNPVTSKAIKAALDQKVNSVDINPVNVTFSTARSEDSKALEIKSFTVNESGNVTIYNVPDAPLITVDTEISADSENPVQNKVIKAALDAKQDTLVAGDNITIVDNVISATATVDVDDKLSATSTNPVQNKVIKAALDDKIDASSITISESVSQDQNALTAKSFTFTDSGVSTIYNIRDGSVPQLLTAGYVYSTAVTSGDTITDANLIEAYTAHMPITINGHLLSYQDTVGTSVRYLYSTLSDSKVYVNLVELDTTSHIITFHEVNLSAGGGVTEERVQEMINESIISAINSSY